MEHQSENRNAVVDILRGFLCKKVIWMGNNSLYLYLCQIVCLNIGIGVGGGIRALVIFVTATGISCFMTIIIKRIKILDAILFGRF